MINKWEIYHCDLNPTLGSEQKGARPVLVVSNNLVNHNLPIVTILPLSSIKGTEKIYPTEIFLPVNISGLTKDSVAMVHQIRTISKSRLRNKISTITDISYQEKIKETIRNYFEL